MHSQKDFQLRGRFRNHTRNALARREPMKGSRTREKRGIGGKQSKKKDRGFPTANLSTNRKFSSHKNTSGRLLIQGFNIDEAELMSRAFLWMGCARVSAEGTLTVPCIETCTLHELCRASRSLCWSSCIAGKVPRLFAVLLLSKLAENFRL